MIGFPIQRREGDGFIDDDFMDEPITSGVGAYVLIRRITHSSIIQQIINHIKSAANSIDKFKGRINKIHILLWAIERPNCTICRQALGLGILQWICLRPPAVQAAF